MAVRKVLLLSGAAAALLGLLRLGSSVPSAPAAAAAPALRASPLPPDPAPVVVAPPPAPAPVEEFSGVTTSPVLPEAASPGVLSYWHGRLLTPLRDRAPAPDADLHLPLRFAFPISATRQVRVRIDRHDETGADSGTFTGEAEDSPGSVVILSYVGLAQAGVVQLPGERRAFVINGDEAGHIRVTALDLDRAPGCTPPLIPPLASNP